MVIFGLGPFHVLHLVHDHHNLVDALALRNLQVLEDLRPVRVIVAAGLLLAFLG